MSKEFTIGDRKFELKKLVLGQTQQLAKTLKKAGVKSFDSLTKMNEQESIMFDLLESGAAAEIIAIVLCEKGVNPREKNLIELAEFMANNLEIDKLTEIIQNFFVEGISAKIPEEETPSQ